MSTVDHKGGRSQKESGSQVAGLFAQAQACHRSGNLTEAEALYRQIIAVDAGHVDALANLGMIRIHQGDPQQGVRLLERALEAGPGHPFLYMTLGSVLQDMRRFDEAITAYRRAITLKPDFLEAHVNCGAACLNLERPDEAIACFDCAIALRPDIPDLHFNRGIALYELGRATEAVAGYDRAIALNPDHADAHYNRAIALQKLERTRDALASYERAIAARPDFAKAYCNRGVVLQSLMRMDEAIASFDRAIALNAAYVYAYYNRGNALGDAGRLDEALASYQCAIDADPGYAPTYQNRGCVLQAMKAYEQACADFDRVLAIDPDFPYALGERIHSAMLCCDWENFEQTCARLENAIDSGRQASAPMALFATPTDLAHQLKCAQIYTRGKYQARPEAGLPDRQPAHERIRIGYFSSDYKDHPVAHLIARLVELHDRDRFEVSGFAFGPPVNDAWRSRMERAFDHFHDLSGHSDEDAATLVRKLEIDIAVDLNGHTLNARTGVFARRCAPVQVNYLGYIGSMGADYFDYIIADRLVIPERHRQYFSEKVVYLPHCYQVNDADKPVSDRRLTRSELGLADDAFVFCCFNSNYKITPDVFEIWMRLLRNVEGSQLWLYEGHPAAVRNLRNEVEKRGVSAERLVFAKRLPLDEHLARYRAADLFLDTFYYNAGATAGDALRAGVPVVTLLGEKFAARMAASLLYAVGLPELVASDRLEYEALAMKLATDRGLLASLRRQLIQDAAKQSLFDTRRFTGHLEQAYRIMHERLHTGLAPDHIVVDSGPPQK